MRTNALFFPLINLPNGPWVYSSLLYWDRISSIVPVDYFNEPENFHPFMRKLVQENLVIQIAPGQYIRDKDSFAEPFLEFVENRLNTLGRRVNLLTVRRPFYIHLEKIELISVELEQLGVIREDHYPWFKAIPWVGEAYMAYLAMCLGLNSEIDSQPITNNERAYSFLQGFKSYSSTGLELKRVKARHILLERILPCPRTNPNLPDLLRFKESNRDLIAPFRRHIEDICLDLANRPSFSEEQIKNKADMLRLEADELANRMRLNLGEILWKDVLPITTVATAIAASVPINASGVISATTGLITAILQFSKSIRGDQDLRRNALAYASLANKAFRIEDFSKY